MPRHARELNDTNVYHVIIRGNERKNIFEYDDDKQKFIETIFDKQKQDNYILYAYCIMDNHAHLVIENKKEELDRIMKSINTTYACYYNRINKRVGHVFQDRFRSEGIKDEIHLLSVIRYIHYNPVKANMVEVPSQYKWSSYKSFINGKQKYINTEYILNLFSKDKRVAVQQFADFSKDNETLKFIDIEEVKVTKMSDKEADKYISDYLRQFGVGIMDLSSKKKVELRENIIKDLKNNERLSIRQIARMLGVSKGMVQRVK